jgi:hypothetical protein
MPSALREETRGPLAATELADYKTPDFWTWRAEPLRATPTARSSSGSLRDRAT